MTMMSNNSFIKNRSNDRILILKQKEGSKVTGSTGLVDPRLFKGGNGAHIKMDSETTLWYFQYEQGGLPEPLKQRFTNYDAALKHATNYYNSRGLEVVEVKDVYAEE